MRKQKIKNTIQSEVKFPTDAFRKWLIDVKLSVPEFAKKSEFICETTLYAWLKHEKFPKLLDIYALQKATNYHFKLSDFIDLKFFPNENRI
jgi:hypothetical protein